MHSAFPAARGPGDLPHGGPPAEGERRLWHAVQFVVSAALLSALVAVLVMFYKSSDRLPLDRDARAGAALLLIAGTAYSAVRTVILLRRLLAPPGRR